jgi:glycosyltransferase involved in cell wall biosynthesis
MASVPVIVHGEHGTIETRPRNLLLQRIVWGRLDRILSVSTRLTERLVGTVGFPPERIETIRNGVDANRFTPSRRAAARSAFGFGPAELVVGTVGRLEPVKHQHSFVCALAALHRQGLRFTAVIAGDGPLRDSLAEYTQRLGLGETVRFLGKRSDVEDVLASFDIFVSSSRSEGLSNTILEAMATGLPVVATDVGGTDELVQHGTTGLLVRANDSETLASAIRSLALDDEQRQIMGRAGRRRVESEFDLAGMIRRYEELYLRLARA